MGGGEDHRYVECGDGAAEAFGEHAADVGRIRHRIAGGEGAHHLRHIGFRPVLDGDFADRGGDGPSVGDGDERVGRRLFGKQGRGISGDDGAGILPGIDLRHSCAFQPVPSYQRVLQLHQTFEWMPDLDAYHAPVARFAEQPRDGGTGVSNLRGNLRLRQIVRVIHASDFQHELDVVSRLSCRHCQLVCNHGIILFHPVWPVNIC